MEKELFLTGYCRCIDQSRMVTLVTEDGKLTEVDCNFEGCVHTPNCTIATAIMDALNQGDKQ